MPARRWLIGGGVQGVGFRPFLYRLATSLGLSGSARNLCGIVEVIAQGGEASLDEFSRRVITDSPQISSPFISSVEVLSETELQGFAILSSADQGEAAIHLPVDHFTCSDCLEELENPSDRRFQYPFINCSQCGPRYTLIHALPYDRRNTSMGGFPLCVACQSEYQNPLDRRFHAEPIACPECGPSLYLGDGCKGNQESVDACLQALRQGKIVAVKGIGGYHLLCDAGNQQAVERLRARKRRPHKPLALMLPTPKDDPLRWVNRIAKADAQSIERLMSSTRPILLLPKKPAQEIICEAVAPGLAEVGLMLPYSPLHHLLLSAFARPLVATSGNLSGEPVLTDPVEAERGLAGVADLFVHHDRPILRPADDSVMRVIRGKPCLIRAGRGIAPMELYLPYRLPRPVLAVGGQMKNTIALAWDNRLVMAPHIGEMDSLASQMLLGRLAADLQAMYQVQAEAILCDAHPGYSTSLWAERQGLPVHRVWHHHAHAAAPWVADEVNADVLMFTWDGTGLGEDGTLWGGEALVGRPGSWLRFASLRKFKLPGGDRAGRAPWRSAAGLCWEADILCPLPQASAQIRQAWRQGINAPYTSAVGRLFDGMAALLGICAEASFEGQAPMLLETMAESVQPGLSDDPLDFDIALEGDLLRYDWQPLLRWLMQSQQDLPHKAWQVHFWLARMMLDVARRVRQARGISMVGFSGGVFQNRLLSELAAGLLEQDGFDCILRPGIPLNDGGLCLGQVRDYLAECSSAA